MDCQEIDAHLKGGNSKRGVVATNPFSSNRQPENRMWEGKVILYTESKLAPEHGREGMHQNDTSGLKVLILPSSSHTKSQKMPVKINKMEIKAGYYLCIGNDRGSLSRTAYSPGTTKLSSFLARRRVGCPLESDAFPRRGFSRDVGFCNILLGPSLP